MLAGQTLKANLATVRATTTMDSLIIGANNCTVSGVVLDCNNSQGTASAQSDGAHNGVDLSDTVGAKIFSNRFTKYRHGIRLYSTGTTVAGKALIYGNEFDAGYEWPSSKPDNFQLGIYAGSTKSAASTNILDFDTLRPEAAYCAQIVIVGNRFNRGQYGVALHRASNCTVSGNNFARMSRAVSLQQQSTDINVTGNSFTELLSTGVHIVYGTRGVAVSGNSFNGTMANDNSFVQTYYGVSDITITGNKFDSKFGDYAGGGYGLTDTRRPGNGVRIGQQAENITVANNTFRGFFAAIRVQSTIYETNILPTDVNYYNTGFRKIKITGNTIIGDYYVPVTTGYKSQMTNTQTYGVYLYASGGWEDNTLGGWDVEDVLVSGNTVDGVAFGYVIQQATMTAASPITFRDRSVKLTDNNTRNITAQEYILTGAANTQTPMVMRNSWNPSVTWASAAPTVGTHKRGDIVYSTTPSASGNIGWVCTTAGTPGTWKTFGIIAA
jgi:parallel beta-helix repeat protein